MSSDTIGEHYSFSLMTTAFNPGAHDYPDIPIHLAAVNEGNVRLAGELADGICLHPFNTPKYTRESIVPWLEDATEEHGRSLDDLTVSASPFVITGETEKERQARRGEVRMRIAFYASTPSYKPVMQAHGWEDTGRKLWKLSKEGRWGDMVSMVTDEMVETFAVEAPLDEISGAVLDEYGDVADRIALDVDTGFEGQDFWHSIVKRW